MNRAISYVLAIAAVLSGMPDSSSAHEVRPGLLELRETSPDTYSLLWKKPAGGETEIQIAPVIPDGCTMSTSDRQQPTPGAFVMRGLLRCEGGIQGKKLSINGLESTVIDVIVRIELLDGRKWTAIVHPSQPSVQIAATQTKVAVSGNFVVEGIRHILFGADHMLFVLGLLLIVKNRWMLLKTITAFTIAHSITLAIATLGYANAPMVLLNAGIALSILFLGPEIVRSWRGETSFTIQHPWVVAFAFGLLHGFGFASALTNAGLPRTELPLALLSFNVGVEIGQVSFVALVLLLERSFRVLEIRWPRFAKPIPGYTVGSLGALWTIQRVVILLGVTR
jgi:hydrogenase/urease accessory protein HupE